MLTKQIEKAQKKVEEQNFLIRKRVLDYDDVMNEQRRDHLRVPRRGARGPRHGRAVAREEIADVSRASSTSTRPGDYIEEWDLEGLFAALAEIFPIELRVRTTSIATDRPRGARRAAHRGRAAALRRARGGARRGAHARARALPAAADHRQRWREHLYDMDYLREGIHLRGFAQIEPLVAYKNEAFELFQDLMNTIWADFARMVFNVEVEVEGTEATGDAGGRRDRVAGRAAVQLLAAASAPSSPARSPRPRPASPRCGGIAAQRRQRRGDPEDADGGSVAAAPRRRRRPDRPQRPLLVRSGKKFKKCHGASAAARP